ncbi:MAG: hypothetical protein DMG96_20535 [Acidobacteria bacterium]|nr:MAG: hypothetical protein DMG96_20535 [Acidobacteriota bacterium]
MSSRYLIAPKRDFGCGRAICAVLFLETSSSIRAKLLSWMSSMMRAQKRRNVWDYREEFRCAAAGDRRWKPGSSPW